MMGYDGICGKQAESTTYPPCHPQVSKTPGHPQMLYTHILTDEGMKRTCSISVKLSRLIGVGVHLILIVRITHFRIYRNKPNKELQLATVTHILVKPT